LKRPFFLFSAGIIFILILFFLFFIFVINKKEKISEERTFQQKPALQQEMMKTEETIKVLIFLPSPEDEFLHPEERKILKTPSLSNQVKQVLLEIFKGSEKGNLNPIPPQTQIREVYIHKDGTAYLDLSSDFVKGNAGGSSSEIEAIYSIVNSITFNFPNIKRVHFLIDGMERETLKGHLRFDRSFLPNYSIIKE